MTETVILKKTAKTGQQIEVRLNTTIAIAAAQLFVDGQFIAGPARPMALKQPKGEVTHWMGREGKTVVGLTAAEAERIDAALAETVRAWRESEAGQADAARTARQNAVIELQEQVHEEREAVRRIVEAH